MLGGQGREINYKTTLTDATAAGVNSTLSSIGKVDAAYQRIEKRETEVTRESHNLRKAFDRVAKSADPLARAQQRYNRDLTIAKKALREGAASTEEYDRAVKGLNTRLKQSEQRASGAQNQYNKITGTLRTLAGVAAAAGVSLSAVSLGREAINDAAAFQQQMANVSAITGAVGGQLEALGKQARDLGASTAFSATEAAAGMEELGRAGFRTNEIIASISGTLDLAAAGQLGLARASEISSSVLRGFNLEAEQSGRVADIIAAASTRSAQDVSDLGEAMKFAAPTAVAFGVSIEETTASIAKLADAGLKGGLGGRGFTSFITKLAQNRDDIVEIIGDFDLAEEGLTSVIKKIADANISNAKAIDLFSAENIDIYTTLSLQAQDAANGTAKLADELKNVRGEAQRIAEIKFTTFKGLADELGGSLEELRLEFSGGTLGEVGAGAGALPALERTIATITEGLRTEEAKNFARELGEGVGAAIDGLRENWDGVVKVTQAATAAAVAYGVSVGGSAIAKGVAAVRAQSVALAEQTALERAYQIASVNTAQAEAAKTAARVRETQATVAQLGATLQLVTAQRAEAASQLALQQAMAVSTGRRAGVAAAETALHASTRGLIQTRRALAAAETQLATAQKASSVAAATAAHAQTAYAAATARSSVAMAAGTTAAGRMALAYTGLATAAKASGAALAFASTGGLVGIARAAPGITKTLAAATALSAVNFTRAIAGATGLSAALGFLATPAGALIAISAAVVLFGDRLDGSRKKINDFDRAVKKAFEDAGDELPDRLKAGLDKSKQDLERFEQDYRRILRSINEAQKDEIEAAERKAAQTATQSGGYLGVALPTQSPSIQASIEAAQTAADIAAQKAVYRERYGDVPIGLFKNGFQAGEDAQNALKTLNERIEAFDFAASSAEARAAALGVTVEELARLQNEAADAARNHADEEANLSKKIGEQRASINQQISNLKALNKLRSEGAGENEIESLERRQALRKQNADLSQEEFDRLADQLDAEVQLNELYEARTKKQNDLAEARKKAAEDAAEAVLRAEQRLADTATDLFVDVWRSFRREGETAIDVIKDYFRNALDNVVGNIFQNLFDGIFVQRQRNSLGFSGGGLNPLALASAGGSITDAISGGPGVAPSSGGVAALVAQANGLGAAPGAGGFGGAFNLSSIFSGVNGGLNRLAESLANPIENLLGLGSKGGLALRGALKGAGTGLLVSQGVNALSSLFGFGDKGNTGATIGGTLGGIGGSFLPIPGGKLIGSVVGSVAGKIFGSLFAGKPSDKIGQTVIDPLTGRTLGTGQKDSSEQSNQNLRIAREIGDQVSSGIKSIIELTGGSIADNTATALREDLLNIAAGSRDGIRIGNQSPGGAIANLRTFENTEEGAAAAVAAGIELSLRNLKGGDPVLAPFVRSLAEAGEPVDSIVQKLGVLKNALSLTEEPLSRWEQSVRDVKSAFDEALSITTKNSEAEKALTQARKDALAELGSTFDKDIERQRLSIEAPLEGQALDLLDVQKQRFDDLKAVSTSAADEQARLTKVLALNTAEWKQFVDQASTAPEALSAATAALEKYADDLRASGVDTTLIDSQIGTARQGLAAEINRDTAQRLLNIANPALAQFNQLLEEQQARVNAATAVGANVGGVERLNALERTKFIEGLSDEDRVSLGNFLGIIEDQSGRLAFVLSDLRLAFGSQIRHVDELAQAYENTASIWKAANDNVRGSLSDLRTEFRGGNLQNQLDQALQRFDSALATARNPGASEDARAAAQSDLGAFGREAATAARELYGTAPKFQDIFNRIESGLETALGEGEGIAARALSDADITRASLDALNRIDNALNQPSLDLPVLEESRNHLADIANDNSTFVERLDELISLERLNQQNASVSVDGLSQVSAPLTANTGNPVQDAQIAQQVAAAVARVGEAQIQAAAAASEVQSEELQDLRDEVNAVKQELETVNTLLRRIAAALEGSGSTTTSTTTAEAAA